MEKENESERNMRKAWNGEGERKWTEYEKGVERRRKMKVNGI